MLDQSKSAFAVIFDVDGVLIDSEKLTADVLTILLARRGIDFSKLNDPSGQNHIGGNTVQLIGLVKDQFGVDIDREEFAKERSIEVEKILQGSTPEKGLTILLDELKVHNVSMAVATSSEQRSAHIKLDILGVKENFEIIVTGSDVENHKPHPEPYLTAARKLGVKNTHCIAIEDSVLGLRAARAAGMKVVAFLKHSRLDTSSIDADLTVYSWDDISYETLEKLFY